MSARQPPAFALSRLKGGRHSGPTWDTINHTTMRPEGKQVALALYGTCRRP